MTVNPGYYFFFNMIRFFC